MIYSDALKSQKKYAEAVAEFGRARELARKMIARISRRTSSPT